MKRITILVMISLLLLGLLPGVGSADARRFKYRWVMLGGDMSNNSAVARLQGIMKTASAAGYNGIALSVSLSGNRGQDSHFLANLKSVRETADRLGLDIYPMLSPYIFGVDRNLGEGPPVHDAVFIAHNGQATLEQNPASAFANGDFEQVQGNTLSGWTDQSAPGVNTFPDTDVHHGGTRSVRMENFMAGGSGGVLSIGQMVPVTPYREYKISVWVKTQDFTPGELQMWIRGRQEGAAGAHWRDLAWPDFSANTDYPVNPTEDWTQICVIFNSLDSTQVHANIGVDDARGGGKVWLADAKFEEVGLLNVIRRDGCPLVVKGEDGTVYKEGGDYNPVKDERLGNYSADHVPPVITLTPDSRIEEGQHLKVSYFHRFLVYAWSDACCLSDPKVFAIIGDEIKRVNDVLHPKGIFMGDDEMRCANWCDLCTSRHLTPGEMLSDSVNRVAKMIKEVNPKAKIFDWTDMFDPYHNAVDHYYEVNGTWAGSWKGLPKDLIMVNWNSQLQEGKRKKSLEWFAGLKHDQILAGYYDDPKALPGSIQSWLKDAGSTSRVIGVMYTTWEDNFDSLGAFAQAAWGDSK